MLTVQTPPQPITRSGDTPVSPASCLHARDKSPRWNAANAAWRLLRSGWYFVRQVSGDDAYERYRDHVLQAHASQPAMTRSEYYKVRTEQKWNRVTRCC